MYSMQLSHGQFPILGEWSIYATSYYLILQKSLHNVLLDHITQQLSPSTSFFLPEVLLALILLTGAITVASSSMNLTNACVPAKQKHIAKYPF